jgi:glycosyltransferase involved in cell wall biosynthesis
MNDTISVIVTVYNRFELTKRAVESVLGQSIPVTEVILIDDGSCDGTSELLAEHVAANPLWCNRVRYFRQENQGPGAARNNALTLVSGEWLAFIDNDDLWLPQKLEWQFRALSQFEGQCGACITDAWFMNNPDMKMTLFELAGKQHREQIGAIPSAIDYLLARGSAIAAHPIWLQNLVVRTKIAREVGGFDSRLRFGDDDDFAFRLACRTRFCFVNMPMVIIDRTAPAARHIGASSEWDKEEFRLRMAQLRYEKRLEASGQLSRTVRSYIYRDVAAVYSGWANWFLKKGEYAAALAAARKAADYRLSSTTALKWLLTRTAPTLARKAVVMREERRYRLQCGIG